MVRCCGRGGVAEVGWQMVLFGRRKEEEEEMREDFFDHCNNDPKLQQRPEEGYSPAAPHRGILPHCGIFPGCTGRRSALCLEGQ